MNGEDAQTPASDLSSPIIELEPPPPISPPISSTTSPTTPHLPHPPGSAADGTRVRLVKLPQSSKPSERAEERASRLSVRLPHGEVIELPFSPLTTIDELLSYLACKQGAAMEVSTAEELVEAYALLDRSAFPPSELDDSCGTFSEAGLSPGCTLVLQRRGAQIRKGERRAVGKLKPKKQEQQQATAASGGAGGGGGGGAGGGGGGGGTGAPRPKVASSRLEVPGGRISGRLTGSYTFEDGAFRRGGMAVLVVEPTAEGDAVLASLQPELHFLCFGFRLPNTTAEGTPPGLNSWRDDVHEVLQWLVRQAPQLRVRALIGHGAAADVCHAYATRYGDAASSPVRMLVQLNGSHSTGGAAAPKGSPLGSSAFAWPTGQWQMLSIVGDADPRVSVTSAVAFHERHVGKGHKLRVLRGADRALRGHHTSAAASSINDWIEGARRLTSDDLAAWDATAELDPARIGTTTGGGAPHASRTATAALDVAPPLGSMERVRDLQAECMCDDLPVFESMTTWTEARLRLYFENGGESGAGGD